MIKWNNLILFLVLFFSFFTVEKALAQEELRLVLGEFNDQATYYISKNSVRVRATPETNSKILGELSLNDKVKIINPLTIYDQKYIEIVIVKTFDPILKSEKYFVNAEYLSPKIVDYKIFNGKYFVVVNVATETLRAYERVCMDNSCPHKMILETEVVVGEDTNHPKEDKGKGRSILGSYRVVGWSKFYQDPEGHYPAWYKDGYPDVPAPDASWNNWFSNSVMPKDENGKAIGVMRGAFGWYTAFVEPEAFGQWTHGTIGWGSDGDKYIKKVKKKLINLFSNPRSSGCTRNNNQAIAFLKSVMEVGAPIIKIYAKEQLLDSTNKNYPEETNEWKYVLTKTKNDFIEREKVLTALNITANELDSFWELKKSGGEIIVDPKSPLKEVLEVGTYVKDIHPDVISYTPGEKLGKFKRKIGRKGNVYGVLEKNMFGVFYVDAGLLENYAHPTEILEVGGFRNEVTPPFMMRQSVL